MPEDESNDPPRDPEAAGELGANIPQPESPTGAPVDSQTRDAGGAQALPAEQGAEPADQDVESTPEEREPAAGARDAKRDRLTVVGIGASAGGLDALGELLPNLPAEMAYVVVQHLAPDHPSMLAPLLSRSTKLDVATAADGMALEPGTIYVIPPSTDLAVMNGTIHLVEPAPQRHLPVDYLFRSLAEDLGSAAIGIVLSGTGTDGTFGLQAIKAAGGLTFAQDPATAKYDGMPRSALSQGAADVALAPKAIGAELARVEKHPFVRERTRGAAPPPQSPDQLSKLFVIIRSELGTDLSHYKQSTIERRVERRMALHRIERLADYVRLVQQDRDELRALYQDMLITVTRFFRDPEVFAALERTVFPKLFERRDPNAPIRVWVPACATGEEAYSLAMSLAEYCEEHGRDTRIQIFGTDIDEDSIQHARQGTYAANIALDVSTERINRFFVQKDNELQVSRRIRDMLVFSKQNVLKDAPFSRIDLVSCRNLLIYLQPPAQKKVLRILHYALNPSGYLLLGSSETVGDAPELFATVDRKYKIYSKRNVAAQAGLDVSFGAGRAHRAAEPVAASRSPLNLQGLADRKVLELYGPAGVVIDQDLEILQFRGRTGPYLDPAPGAASLNILKVARFELHIELKRTIQQATATQQRVTTEITYSSGDEQRTIALDVVPLHDPETKVRCLLVLFEPKPPPREIVVASDAADPESAARLGTRVRDLERELALTKEYLQTTVEEKESTLEELKSANEELQSSNEELQSTNEELETSKEEMQSTNEELTTVNDELQNRMAELSQTNDDLHNVLSGVDNAVVIVGMDLRIRRYTAAAEKLFNLLPTDVGRSIAFLDPFLGTAPLEAKVSGVIHRLAATDEEVLASNQRWYSLRVTPYKTLDHTIRGALLTFIDIDVRKRADEMSRDVGAYADRFLAPIGHPLAIVDRKVRVVWCNDPFLTVFKVVREEVIGSPLFGLGSKLFDDPGLEQQIEHVITTSSVFRDYLLRVRSRDVELHGFRVGGTRVPASGDTTLALLSFEPASAERRRP